MDFTKSNIIKGLLFSAYDKFGPTPIYMFPSFIKNENSEVIENKSDDMLYLTLRDYTQISIKNLSLFSTNITSLEEKKQKYYFGIIPHPDFHLTSIVYFSFIHFTKNPQPVQAAISLLVNENKRNFLYNNHERIRKLLEMFFEKLDENLSLGYKAIEEIKEIFDSLFNDLLKIESTPSTPITNQRKMKILFSGLSNSGKTSFLLSVDRKFSKVLNIKPTRGANIQSMNALGSTIFLWDLGGQSSFRSKYISKYQIYLFETDLLFYFIDIKDEDRFEESFRYLKKIYTILNEQLEQQTSIIYILSKADLDILKSRKIKNNVNFITKKIKEITNEKDPEIYSTSIFDITTILRAFSSGIAKLSPNRELINLNIAEFAKDNQVQIMLLLSKDGLLLADYYSNQSFPSLVEKRNIFEITAPQFTILYRIFAEFQALQKNETIFKIANTNICINKIDIENLGSLFLLFAIEDINKKNEIDDKLSQFLKKTEELLMGYIS